MSSNARRARELNDTIRYTLWSVFRLADVLGDAGDGVELVEGVVEAHLRDRGAGDRRQQGPPEGVAERVAEAGLERTDGEPLPVLAGVLERLDRRALDDEHERSSPRGRGTGPHPATWMGPGCVPRGSSGPTWSRARR